MAYSPLSEIDAEIAATEARLIELRIEREQARKSEIDQMCRLFDAGKSLRQIARDVGQTKAAVQGVLYRSGRTEIRRTAIRHQIERRSTHGEHVDGGHIGSTPERERLFPVGAS